MLFLFIILEFISRHVHFSFSFFFFSPFFYLTSIHVSRSKNRERTARRNENSLRLSDKQFVQRYGCFSYKQTARVDVKRASSYRDRDLNRKSNSAKRSTGRKIPASRTILEDSVSLKKLFKRIVRILCESFLHGCENNPPIRSMILVVPCSRQRVRSV